MSATPSFFDTTPEPGRADDLLRDYLRFLEERNGTLDADGFERREQMMEGFDNVNAHYKGHVDGARFNRNYASLVDRDLSTDELALLAMVKLNAGEAYGVEVTGKARAHLMSRPEPIYQTEKILNQEEQYHTRMLVGVAAHFRGVEVTGAWTPVWPLKLLIFALAKAPPSIFHPILLASEISGVFTFNAMLARVGTLFPDDPAIRESMERRLIEILIDEVGHIAYNRIAISQRSMSVVRPMAGMVSRSSKMMVPEIAALGVDFTDVAGFDYGQLPAEVRERAFYV